MKNKQTIFITGGHVTPAIALIDALQKNNTVHIVFIGRTYTTEGSRTDSFEHQLIREKGIQFIPIVAGRHTFPSLFKIPIGFVQALMYCARYRPALIVSFGGYVALPVAIAGWLFRVPIITHEQTFVAGLANVIIARIAKRVCVTFPETLGSFPKEKSVYTGLPIRQELFTPPKQSPFPKEIDQYPLLYITGGGTGARSLNQLLFPVIPALLTTYSIIHQAGNASLPEAQKIHHDRYIAAPYFPLSTVSWIYAHAALIIGRSGANTVIELAALGKVAMLIPLPWAGSGEQQKNAEWFIEHGGGVVLDQRTVSSNMIVRSIDDTMKHMAQLQQKSSAFSQTILRDGTKRLVIEIEKFLYSTA